MWSNDLEIFPRGNGLWGYVDGEVAGETTSDDSSAQKRDMDLAYNMMSITPACKASLMTCRDPDELWNKLKRLFLSVSEASIDAKLKRLQNIKMTAKGSVTEYSNEFQSLANELKAAGH